MLFIYSLLMYLLTPFIVIRLWIKGRSLPAYRKRISERLAWSIKADGPVDIWLHAVSLGEAIAAIPLIDALLQQHKKIMVTTMTPTGSARILERFGSRVYHQYLPYDLPHALNKFFSVIRPKAGIIMETELWPNMIDCASKAGVKLFLANARLSEKSCKGYMNVRWFFKPRLEQFELIMAQSPDDAARFIKIGAPAERVMVAGNIKFDLQTQLVNPTLFVEQKALWGNARPVVIIASTHNSEESLFLPQYKTLLQHIPEVILLIAPRHPERFQEVYDLSVSFGLNTGRRSSPESISSQNEVVILDSLGELLGWFSVSDYAFIGGSLVPIGGHNLLEPIAMGVPTFTGPYTHHFKAICTDLLRAQAVIEVDSAERFVAEVTRLHQNAEARECLVKRATRVLEDNKGALQKHLDVVLKVME